MHQTSTLTLASTVMQYGAIAPTFHATCIFQNRALAAASAIKSAAGQTVNKWTAHAAKEVAAGLWILRQHQCLVRAAFHAEP